MFYYNADFSKIFNPEIYKMITLNNIIEYLETKPKAIYFNNIPRTEDDFTFFEIGIQQTSPKFPKRFLNIFEEKDKNILGIYFRHIIGQEEELYKKYDWIKKGEFKGYSRAAFDQNTPWKDVQILIDQSYETVLNSLTKAEQKSVENLKNEKNNFFIFDELARKFEDGSKKIYLNYRQEIQIEIGIKCVIRFEDNMIINTITGEQSKDYTKWEEMIKSALAAKI